MIDTYVRLIEADEMTLDDVKPKFREKVRQRLIEDGWIEVT